MLFLKEEGVCEVKLSFPLKVIPTWSSILFRKTHSSVLPLNLPPGVA